MPSFARSLRSVALVFAVPATAAAIAVACNSSTTTTGYTPITGIFVRASSLVSGLGCGTGPGQVYRYAAVARYADDPAVADGGILAANGDAGLANNADAGVWVNVFDCFADGLFENLPPSPKTGTLEFKVAIYAWNADAYARSGLPPSLDCPPTSGTAFGCQNYGVLPGTATWTTTCDAQQQAGTPVLAVCAPLVPVGAGAPGDGGATDAGDGGATDAGDDGGPDAAGDAETGETGSDASVVDAGDAGAADGAPTDAGDGG